MKLVVFSHKSCWRSPRSPSGYATDGGFSFQMRAISELFDATTLVVLCNESDNRFGEIPLSGYNLSVVSLTPPWGSGLWRKLAFPFWLLRHIFTILREAFRADAIHAPIPGDVGTIGMLLARLLQKPLFVRHCGNWFNPKTVADHFWKWFMECFAGERNVMLATGGAPQPPSQRNPAVHWIFSTSLTKQELQTCAVPRQRVQTAPNLLIACRQEREKGTGVVIEALPLLRGDFPAVRLRVVGDGSALSVFRQQAAKRCLEDYVTFYGRVTHEEVLALMQWADLFCYPTAASEGFPKVVLEALACGLPVITTRVSVLPQLLASRCGILLDERTPEALASAVCWCLADKERYRAMSTQAVATARGYSLERWRDEIGTHLREAWGPLRSDERT